LMLLPREESSLLGTFLLRSLTIYDMQCLGILNKYRPESQRKMDTLVSLMPLLFTLFVKVSST
jgi:hypothetical protein